MIAGKIVRKIKSSISLRNIIKMMTGTLSGQIISTILVPVSTRLYGVALFGNLAIFNSTSSLIIGFLGFGLSQAVMVAQTEKDAEAVYKLQLFMTNILVMITIIVLISVSKWFKIFDLGIEYNISILLLGFFIILCNLSNMTYAWLNRKGLFNVLLFNPMIMPLVNNIVIIILSFTSLKLYGLLIGSVLAQLATNIHMRKYVKMNYKLDVKDIREIISKNKDFILFQYPAGFINNLVGQLPTQILYHSFGNTILGYYSMAIRLVNIPSGLISSSLSRVYIKEASELERDMIGTATGYTLRITKIVMLLFLIPTVIIIFFGDWGVPFVLGEDWANSVVYLKIMMCWNLFAIGVNSTSGFSSVIHQQKSSMFVSIVKLIIFPVALYGAVYTFRLPVITVAVYAVSYSIINILYYNFLIGKNYELKNKYLSFNLIFVMVLLAVIFISNFFS